jgi:hypothetical protein
MHRLHAGRFTRLLAAAGTAIVLGFLLPTSSAAASPTAASLTAGTTAASLTAAPAAAPPAAYRIIATLPCQCYNGQKAMPPDLQLPCGGRPFKAKPGADAGPAAPVVALP